MASEKIIAQKEKEVKQLAEKIKTASLVLLVDYRGINVADVTGLRKSVREVGAEYSVIKNNITRRALKECGIEELNDAKPIYEYLPGFQCDISNCRTVADLPKEALEYIRYIEKMIECPIKYVSVGAERDAYITMF